MLKKVLGGLALTVLVGMVPARAGTVSMCDAVSGNLVLNCGFETGDLTDWTVSSNWQGGFEDFIVSSPGYYGAYVNSGSYAVFLENFAPLRTLSQSFADVQGATYQIMFYLLDVGTSTIGSQFDANWNSTSVFEDSGGGSPSSGWTEETLSVTGTGFDSITFAAYSASAGYALDDVSVVETAGPSPEPPSAILLALGICSAALLAGRRKSA